jgi:hypothetical protein
MVFSSPIFICVFLPLVLSLYVLLPRSTNNPLFLVASLIFYARGDPLAAVEVDHPVGLCSRIFSRGILPTWLRRRGLIGRSTVRWWRRCVRTLPCSKSWSDCCRS